MDPFFITTTPAANTVTTTPPTSTLSAPRQRALDDLLQAERLLREKNEGVLREVQQVLLETANRLDGERFEALRRDDPAVPGSWTPADWRNFFAQISKGWGNGGTQDARVIRLEQQIINLEKQLAKAASQPKARPSRTEAPVSVPEETPDVAEAKPIDKGILLPGVVPPLSALIRDAARIKQLAPQKPSGTFSKHLTGGGRTGGDLQRAFQRYWIVLYMIGHWGLTVSTELEEVVAGVADVAAGSGSLKRLLGDLFQKSPLLVSETLQPDTPHTSLKLFRFSPEGERLYQSMFHQQVIESEWSRLNRLRAGERDPGRSVSMLVFAAQARKRGWTAQVLPAEKPAADVWVSRGGDQQSVEIVMGTDLPKVQGEPGSRIAVCSTDSQSRSQLVEACKREGRLGVATDIDSLVMAKRKGVAENDPLWFEFW
jgi:hypothetical protein